MSDREFYSDFFVTINTHLAPQTQQVKQYVILTLHKTIEEWIKIENLQQCFPQRSGHITKVVYTLGAIEQGDEHKKIHAHINLSLLHKGKLRLTLNGKNINDRTKEWFDQRLPWRTGCYTSVDLTDSSRAKNYAIRAGTNEAEGNIVLPDVVASRAGEDWGEDE